MISERTYTDYFEDILDAIEKIAKFTKGMTYEQFQEDDDENDTSRIEMPKKIKGIRL